MTTKERVYRLLLHGYSASQIATKLSKNKGYISRLIRTLEQQGFVRCINQKSRPLVYVKTPKKFTGEKATYLLPSKQTRLSGRLDIVKIQKCSFICEVVSEPSRATWDRVYQWNRFVEVMEYRHPFRDVGMVVFRRFKSKKKDRLIVVLPHVMVHVSELPEMEGRLREMAEKAVLWLKRRFDMVVSGLQACQRPHHAVPLREPELIEASEKASFTVGTVMVDQSPPDCVPEFESEDFRDIVNYLDVIRKMKWLEQMVRENRQWLMKMHERVMAMSEEIEVVAHIGKELERIKMQGERMVSDLKKKENGDSFVDVT